MNSNEAVNRFLYRPFILSMICICIFFFSSGCTSRTERFLEENTEAFTAEDQSDPGEEEKAEEQDEQAFAVPSIIFVDVCGHVARPGVYTFTEGSRIYEAIEAAGGLRKEADMTNINRAEFLVDGQKVFIPSYALDEEGNIIESSAAGSVPDNGTSSATGAIDPSGKVNINTADSTQLQTLNGVGPATAQKIIDYRDSSGRFTTIEDLKNVSGIGDKTFEKLKDYICI